MCCFSTTTDVHGTKIFARIAKPGTQVLAYQMVYSAASPTAMILPLPVALPARETSVRFSSLKDYPDFFAALERGFPSLARSSFWGTKGERAAPTAAALPVHEVGEFVASFVPTVNDFGRLDPRFVISKELWAKIPEYKDYGFAVFQLKELSGSPHPIAFEFDTRLEGSVFFPTVHIHDGTVHEKEDFDHALYVQSATLDALVDSYRGPESVDERTGLVRSQSSAKLFADAARAQGLLDPELLVHKRTLRGLLPNRDLIHDMRASASTAGGACARCDVASADGGLGGASLNVGLTVAGLAWIIRRRDALRKRGT